jgi:hypothetical protein
MYDIKPLEDEWKKYQLKKRKPIYLGIFFLSLLIIIFFSIMNFSNVNEYISKINNKSVTSEKDNKNVLLKNNALTRLETEEDTRSDKVENINQSSDILVDIPILNVKDNTDTKENSDISHNKIHLDIIETSSVKAYEDVEKRFKQSRDIDDALFLAKSYYKKHNYKKAEYWAYEVNKLDSNIEESLFIFVQAKVKLGHVSEGISILKNYIIKSNSEKAKKLLNRIENNK